MLRQIYRLLFSQKRNNITFYQFLRRIIKKRDSIKKKYIFFIFQHQKKNYSHVKNHKTPKKTHLNTKKILKKHKNHPLKHIKNKNTPKKIGLFLKI